MKIILDNLATKQIDSIFVFNLFFSEKYALKIDNNIIKTINKLETFPYLGRYVPEIKSKKFRELIYEKYRIIYKIDEEKQIVHIAFIVDGRQDIIKFLKLILNQ